MEGEEDGVAFATSQVSEEDARSTGVGRVSTTRERRKRTIGKRGEERGEGEGFEGWVEGGVRREGVRSSSLQRCVCGRIDGGGTLLLSRTPSDTPTSSGPDVYVLLELLHIGLDGGARGGGGATRQERKGRVRQW